MYLIKFYELIKFLGDVTLITKLNSIFTLGISNYSERACTTAK